MQRHCTSVWLLCMGKISTKAWGHMKRVGGNICVARQKLFSRSRRGKRSASLWASRNKDGNSVVRPQVVYLHCVPSSATHKCAGIDAAAHACPALNTGTYVSLAMPPEVGSTAPRGGGVTMVVAVGVPKVSDILPMSDCIQECLPEECQAVSVGFCFTNVHHAHDDTGI